jgi:hypothetical protein
MASNKVDPSSAATAGQLQQPPICTVHTITDVFTGYKVTHMAIVWNADFEKHQLVGSVTHTIQRLIDGANQLVRT